MLQWQLGVLKQMIKRQVSVYTKVCSMPEHAPTYCRHVRGHLYRQHHTRMQVAQSTAVVWSECCCLEAPLDVSMHQHAGLLEYWVFLCRGSNPCTAVQAGTIEHSWLGFLCSAGLINVVTYCPGVFVRSKQCQRLITQLTCAPSMLGKLCLGSITSILLSPLAP